MSAVVTCPDGTEPVATRSGKDYILLGGLVSPNETYRNLLTYALAIAGSERLLAERLGVKIPQLMNWMMGIEHVPTEIFLKTVDVVLNATAEDIARSRDILNKLKSTKSHPAANT